MKELAYAARFLKRSDQESSSRDAYEAIPDP
ncbi:hypothetical protein PENARI_c023G06404 [Penicillium arizonense]|uniref:Uncharacterized protein n=1 Tax=Penicillium arizonense TaxID=1835702 RepID=A0A1F5L7S0_PENAI|nr:hypothetical protein PENARI_c023G06404 [Penicillium arizonense]OGE49117.1 hypothetical protein PENARI_c023G06404 [Penicillium arizonense]